MSLAKEIRFYFFQLGQNMKNKRALRASFAFQVASMILGNLSFYVIWMMFGRAVGPINGWGVVQILGMLSATIFTFGAGHTLFGGLISFVETVPSGAFDSFLTKPKNLYLRVLNGEFLVSALGDLFQGAVGLLLFLFLVHGTVLQVLLLILLLFPAVVAEISFLMICHCVIFWLPQATGLSRALVDLILVPGTQPIAMLGGGLRLVYLFVIPALLVGGLPIEGFMTGHLHLLLLSWVIALAWLTLSIWLLNLSIRRYESGNSIGA